jgi:hypothetical protein
MIRVGTEKEKSVHMFAIAVSKSMSFVGVVPVDL